MDRKPNSVIALSQGLVRPDCSAGDRRFVSILRAIENRYRVSLSMKGVRADVDTKRLAPLKANFKGEILWDEGFGFKKALSIRPYGCCLVEFWNFAERSIPWIRRIAPWLPIIVDSVDVHFVREESAARLGLMKPDVVSANKQRELAVYQAADAVIVVSEQDKNALIAAGVTKPVHVITYIMPGRPRPSMKRESEILFVGGFDHAPNSDGLLWFVRECWPRILSKVPQAKFTVVGSNPTEEILALGAISRISVAGHVPETAPYLDRAAVSVAPLRYGGGVKGKVCEALASGMPLVTTTTGSQGLAIRDYREARVQDEAIPFADAVVWALTHTEAAEAMGVEGRRIVEGICGVEVTSKQVQDIFEVYSQLPTRAEKVKWLFHWLSFKSGARSMKRFFIEEMKARRCLRDARTSV